MQIISILTYILFRYSCRTIPRNIFFKNYTRPYVGPICLAKVRINNLIAIKHSCRRIKSDSSTINKMNEFTFIIINNYDNEAFSAS